MLYFYRDNYFNSILYFYLDEDEVHNNPNFHSEEQDELEIPDGKFFNLFFFKWFKFNFKLLILLLFYLFLDI